MLKHVCHVLKFEALLLSEFSDKNKEHFLSRLSHLILGSTLQGGTIMIHISQRRKQRLQNLAKALLTARGSQDGNLKQAALLPTLLACLPFVHLRLLYTLGLQLCMFPSQNLL